MLQMNHSRILLVSKKDINPRRTLIAHAHRKSLQKTSFVESYLGKESELKMKIRRYVPSQGWASLAYIYKNLAPSLSAILIESSLKELMWGLRGCRIENDKVCRNDWIESGPADLCENSEGKTRKFSTETELVDAMLPYIPTEFVPLRAIALQTPIDIFPALRDSRFLFLVRHPDKFVISHCVDDNTIMARSISNIGRCRILYQRYCFHRQALIAAALAIPSKEALSEIDCLHRIPKTYRRRILSSGYSFSTLASMFVDLFVVEREDELSFVTSIRSKISHPEKSHPDNPRITSNMITKIMTTAHKKLSKHVENIDFSIFRKITTEEEFLQTALDIRQGKSALKYAKQVGAVRDDFIQNEIIECISGNTSEYMEYDELLLKLSPKVRRQLAYEDGGLRKFIQDRSKVFEINESQAHTSISLCSPVDPKSHAKIEPSKCSTLSTNILTESKKVFTLKECAQIENSSEQTEINPKQISHSTLSSKDECEDILSLSNIQNMKDPEKKNIVSSKNSCEKGEAPGDDEDLLASEVARFVPAKGISGIAIRDLALQIGKNIRKQIRAEGFKTFNEFIHEYSEWFIVSGEGNDLYVNLKPFDSLKEEQVEGCEFSSKDRCINVREEFGPEKTETLSPF